VDDEIRFYIERAGNVAGPLSEDELRTAFREKNLDARTRVRLDGSDLWASPLAFAPLARGLGPSDRPPPPSPNEPTLELCPELAATPYELRDHLLFWLSEGVHTFGPLSGEQIRLGFERGRYRGASAALVDRDAFYPVALLFAPPMPSSRPPQPAMYPRPAPAPAVPNEASRPSDPLVAATTRCAVCLESIPRDALTCPECDEPVHGSIPGGSSPSIPEEAPDASWLKLHWRPLVTLGAVASLICTGIALRYLAPGRFAPARTTPKPAAMTAPASCASACWSGEACEMGHCVWQRPNDVGHIAEGSEPIVGGAFSLPKDISDAILLDGERFAISLLTGVEIHSARTGRALGLITDAPQSRRLYSVGQALYATAPQRIYVIDPITTRVLKTIETGSPAGEITLGAGGRRALVSLPTTHAVSVLATEYHAEIDRIQFGDDNVGPMGADDTGKRALVTTGQIPLPGLRDPAGGAVYAFDPGRLGSAQDRVRTSMVGNPVSVLMVPDGSTSFVVLRAHDKLVPLEWLSSGAVRQLPPIPTCREPEQIELLRRDRLGIVRCNEGRSIQILDLEKREIIRAIPFNARVADMAISPDGEQAVVALSGEGNGSVGLVDLRSYEVRILPLSAEPSRVRLASNGKVALLLSTFAKVAWVIR